MADNVAITAGTGTTVHADEYTHSTLGSGKTQLVKLVDGTLDSSTAIAAGGGVEAGALRVTLASDSTGVVSVDDNGGALTVDGTVAVTNADIGTIAGAVAGTEMQVDIVGALPAGTNAIGTLAANSGVDIGDVTINNATIAVTQSGTWDEVGINDSGNSITVDNGGTFVVQENGAALTSLQLIDDTVYTDGTGTPSKAIGVAGTDGTNPQILKTDTSGELQVDVLTMPTVTVTATNLDVQSGGADLATFAQGAAIQTAVETIDNAISGSEMQVDVVGALPAGTNAIGKLAANSGVDIGDVTINNASGASAVNIQDGGNTITVDGTVTANLAAGTNNIGDVDILSIAAGDNNIGNVDVVTLPSLPAGTNAIGKLAANSGVDIGDVTLTAGTDAIGKLLPPDVDVTTHTNYARKYYTNSGAVTDGIIWSPASGKRWHVTTLYIQVSAVATVTLEDDKAGGDDPVWKGELAANSGVVLPFTEKYPMASGEDAADLLITTTAGNVYVTAVGYEI